MDSIAAACSTAMPMDSLGTEKAAAEDKAMDTMPSAVLAAEPTALEGSKQPFLTGLVMTAATAASANTFGNLLLQSSRLLEDVEVAVAQGDGSSMEGKVVSGSSEVERVLELSSSAAALAEKLTASAIAINGAIHALPDQLYSLGDSLERCVKRRHPKLKKLVGGPRKVRKDEVGPIGSVSHIGQHILFTWSPGLMLAWALVDALETAGSAAATLATQLSRLASALAGGGEMQHMQQEVVAAVAEFKEQQKCLGNVLNAVRHQLGVMPQQPPPSTEDELEVGRLAAHGVGEQGGRGFAGVDGGGVQGAAQMGRGAAAGTAEVKVTVIRTATGTQKAEAETVGGKAADAGEGGAVVKTALVVSAPGALPLPTKAKARRGVGEAGARTSTCRKSRRNIAAAAMAAALAAAAETGHQKAAVPTSGAAEKQQVAYATTKPAARATAAASEAAGAALAMSQAGGRPKNRGLAPRQRKQAAPRTAERVSTRRTAGRGSNEKSKVNEMAREGAAATPAAAAAAKEDATVVLDPDAWLSGTVAPVLALGEEAAALLGQIEDATREPEGKLAAAAQTWENSQGLASMRQDSLQPLQMQERSISTVDLTAPTFSASKATAGSRADDSWPLAVAAPATGAAVPVSAASFAAPVATAAGGGILAFPPDAIQQTTKLTRAAPPASDSAGMKPAIRAAADLAAAAGRDIMDYESLAAVIDADDAEGALAAAVRAVAAERGGGEHGVEPSVTRGTPIISCGSIAGILVPSKGARWNVVQYAGDHV
jgi:hypothetical protein